MEHYNWLIRNMKDDSFWSNKIGWVDYSSCQVFTQEEKDKLDLPNDGKWEEL